MYRKYQIELEQETDGRWIVEIEALSGAMVYGNTHDKPLWIKKPWHCVFLPIV
jgi:hypothetical protein